MGIYANARQFPVAHRAIQPAIGFELVRILSPEILVTVIPRPVTPPKRI
jgi:hypothetical protein